MDIEAIRAEREGWFRWKNIAPLRAAIQALPEAEVTGVNYGDRIEIDLDEEYARAHAATIERTARMLMPWRKGPFRIGDLEIDSEWRSQIKYNLLEPHFDLAGKAVADIGCNNGYYLLRMQTHKPEILVGFDPSALYRSQFDFLDHFLKTGIRYEMLGVEHLPWYPRRFDVLFCLGVLYHRSDPVATLKALRKGLVRGGELFLDTFMIDGEGDFCLTPRERYAKIPNVYFIPTVRALENWCLRAGFSEVELIDIRPTTPQEQRKTPWIETQSLEDFLDPTDPRKTVEGYPAPQRVYVRARR